MHRELHNQNAKSVYICWGEDPYREVAAYIYLLLMWFRFTCLRDLFLHKECLSTRGPESEDTKVFGFCSGDSAYLAYICNQRVLVSIFCFHGLAGLAYFCDLRTFVSIFCFCGSEDLAYFPD